MNTAFAKLAASAAAVALTGIGVAGPFGAVSASAANGSTVPEMAFATGTRIDTPCGPVVVGPPPPLKAVWRSPCQTTIGELWTVGGDGTTDRGLGMAAGTSPSIASLTGGGYEVAFQDYAGVLWTTGAGGTKDWGLRMAPGTSPSITGIAGGGYVVAYQADTGVLWAVGTKGAPRDWNIGMMRATSPSITALASGSYEVAVQAHTGYLWTAGAGGAKNWDVAMAPATSPSITGGLTGSGIEDGAGIAAYVMAFQADTGDLWTAGPAGATNLGLAMAPGTSPSITVVVNGYEVAFQANTGVLWTTGNAGERNWHIGMMAGTSPSISSIWLGRSQYQGYEAVVQAHTGYLWTATAAGNVNSNLQMEGATSPSIVPTLVGTGNGGGGGNPPPPPHGYRSFTVWNEDSSGDTLYLWALNYTSGGGWEQVGEIPYDSSVTFYPQQDADVYQLEAVDPDSCGANDPTDGDCWIWTQSFESDIRTPGPAYTQTVTA